MLSWTTIVLFLNFFLNLTASCVVTYVEEGFIA